MVFEGSIECVWVSRWQVACSHTHFCKAVAHVWECVCVDVRV